MSVEDFFDSNVLLYLLSDDPVKNGIAVQVDLTGASAQTGQPARVVGVQVAQPGQTWFYKLMGDPAVVAGQKDAFIHFVQGINY